MTPAPSGKVDVQRLSCPRPGGHVDMHYAVAGGEGPPVVLVHGFACDRSDWRLQAAHLEGTHTVVTPDLAGHGASRPTAPPHRVETLGSDVAALLDALGLEGAYLAGHSMGCRVVMQAWRQAPERVRGLVLVDGSWIGRGADAAGLEAATRTAMGGERFVPSMRTLFTEMFLDNTVIENPGAVVDRALEMDPEVGAALFASVVAWDANHTEDTLERFDGELMVIQSTYLNEDRRRVPMAAGESTPWLDLVRAKRPDATVEVVPGVGHFTMLEAPGPVNALLTRFIENG